MKMYTNLKKRVLAFVLACSLAIPTGIYLNSPTEVQAATSTLKLKTPKVDDATAKKLFDAMIFVHSFFTIYSVKFVNFNKFLIYFRR